MFSLEVKVAAKSDLTCFVYMRLKYTVLYRALKYTSKYYG